MRLMAVGFAVLNTIACGAAAKTESEATGDADPAVAFIDVQLILNGAGCTESGCHGSDKKGGLDLVAAPWDSLVNAPAVGCSDGRKLVAAGNPAQSYLLDKVRGTQLCDGTRMPKGCGTAGVSPCLTDEQVRTLESWIESGAPME